MSFESTIHAKAAALSKLAFEITGSAGSGHPSSSSSLAHLVSVLMYTHMRWEPSNPAHSCSDRLVLSEGHACPIIYAACADLGVMFGLTQDKWRSMTKEDAMTLREHESLIDGHPNPIEGFPFFDAATGSLGQGLSVAAGLAIAARQNELDKRIFCIIGDGEAREGQIWEAIDFIVDEKLNTVCPIFNANEYAQSEAVSPQQSASRLAKKLEAAGMQVRMIDGHDPAQVRDALHAHQYSAEQLAKDGEEAPMAIVAKTVKGWGAPSMQGNGCHGKALKGEALEQALAEIDETARQLGAHGDTPLNIPMMSPASRKSQENTQAPSFEEACKQQGLESIIESGSCATRRAYGIALRAAGEAYPNLMALDADVRGSTFASDFQKADSVKDRFVDCRIAEQNMVSVAAGLSSGGKIPFVSSFAKFLTRAYDQIEMAVNSGANLKLVGSHAGITLGADGPSQMGLPDVAWFRSFATAKNKQDNPLFYLLQPSDAYQTYALTLAMAEYEGPCYMRTTRPNSHLLYNSMDKFKLGGHELLAEGQDLMIIAAGYMVHVANDAVDLLEEEGIAATLVDLYSIPFDEEAILDLANQSGGMVLTIEDNYGGGIGSAVADVMAASGDGFTVNQMFVRGIPKSAKSHDQLLTAAGLNTSQIVTEVKKMLQLTAS